MNLETDMYEGRWHLYEHIKRHHCQGWRCK